MNTSRLHEGIPAAQAETPWIFGLLLFTFVILVFIRWQYQQKLYNHVRAYIALRYIRQIVREELALYHPFSILLLFNFSVVTGLLFYKAILLWVPGLGESLSFVSFLILPLVCMAWIIARSIVFKFIQVLTGADFGQTENRYSLLISNQVLGIFLFPLVVIIFFGPEKLDVYCILLGLILLILNYLYRVGRGIYQGFNYSVQPFYLFLYLCTLEIVPFVVIISTLVRYLNWYSGENVEL